MAAHGDDSSIHRIQGGSFVCTAAPASACRNYPSCECEGWNESLHGDPPAPGHEDQPHAECWIAPWMAAVELGESYGPGELSVDNSEFPDGPVAIDWEGDYLTWHYADGTTPTTPEES
jgi:hypothetical protein